MKRFALVFGATILLFAFLKNASAQTASLADLKEHKCLSKKVFTISPNDITEYNATEFDTIEIGTISLLYLGDMYQPGKTVVVFGVATGNPRFVDGTWEYSFYKILPNCECASMKRIISTLNKEFEKFVFK